MEKRLRWGLIGAGDVADKRIAPAINSLENSELVSVARRNTSQAEEFAKKHKIRKQFSDWKQIVSDPEIDVVYIATPVYLHKEQTIAAAKAGKHVLCEKPMATNAADCDEMIAVCAKNNVKLGVAYYRRFYSVITKVKELLHSGEIGAVSLVQINAFEYFDPKNDHPRRWLLDKSQSGGGPMMDFGCHRIEVLTNLFGRVSEVKSTLSNAAFNRGVEDTTVATFKFESGVIGTITVTHASIEARDTLEIFGTRGTISVPVLNKGELTVRSNSWLHTEFYPPHDNVHFPLIADFATSVIRGVKPEVDGECGQLINRLEDVIYGNAKLS